MRVALERRQRDVPTGQMRIYYRRGVSLFSGGATSSRGQLAPFSCRRNPVRLRLLPPNEDQRDPRETCKLLALFSHGLFLVGQN